MNLIKQQFKSDFSKNIITLFSGNTIAFFIQSIITLILARYFFSPEQFGVLYLFNSIIIVLTEVTTLKYEVAIVLPRKKEIAKFILILSYIITFIISLLVLLFVIFESNGLINFIEKEKSLGNWFYFVPVMALLAGVIQASNYWLNRFKKYKDISRGRVAKSVSGSGVQLIGGIFKLEHIGLIGGAISGQFVNAVFFFRKAYKFFQNIEIRFSFKRMFRIAAYYKNIPIYNTLMGLINTLSNHLPIFLLAGYYGEVEAGLYGMSLRFVAAPMGLVKQSIGEVFYATASSKYNIDKKEFLQFIKKNIKKLFLLGIVPFTLVAVLSPWLFGLIMGEEWRDVGVFTRYLTPWLFLMFINSPLTSVITILRKQKYFVFYDIFLLIARFSGLYFGYVIFNDVLYSVMFFALAGFLFNMLLLIYLIRVANIKDLNRI